MKCILWQPPGLKTLGTKWRSLYPKFLTNEQTSISLTQYKFEYNRNQFRRFGNVARLLADNVAKLERGSLILLVVLLFS